MDNLTDFLSFIFSYCTDFVINLANIFNLSYYEVNFVLFCMVYPILIFGSIGTYIMQKQRLRNIIKKNNDRNRTIHE